MEIKTIQHQPLPKERKAITHRFTVAGTKVYVTVGLYEDGRPGEVFLTCAKQGSLERGLLHCLAVQISISLQHGIQLKKIVEKLCYVKFDPAGVTDNPDIPMVDSISDYLGKWLQRRFGGTDAKK